MAPLINPTLRVMVDANILIAGTIWARFPYEVLQHATKRDYQLTLSQYVIDEAYRGVEKISKDDIHRLTRTLELTQYTLLPTPSKENIIKHRDLVRDAKDIAIALSAIQGNVDYFVTQDRDFTDRDSSTEHLHQQLAIILPGTFLRHIMGWSSEQLETIRHRKWSDIEI